MVSSKGLSIKVNSTDRTTQVLIRNMINLLKELEQLENLLDAINKAPDEEDELEESKKLQEDDDEVEPTAVDKLIEEYK